MSNNVVGLRAGENATALKNKSNQAKLALASPRPTLPQARDLTEALASAWSAHLFTDARLDGIAEMLMPTRNATSERDWSRGAFHHPTPKSGIGATSASPICGSSPGLARSRTARGTRLQMSRKLKSRRRRRQPPKNALGKTRSSPSARSAIKSPSILFSYG